MNMTIFEFLKRFDNQNYEVNIFRGEKMIKHGTLTSLKKEYGIEPFNPLSENGLDKVKDFKITGNLIKILIE